MIPHLHPWRFQNEKKNLGAQTRLTTKEKLMTTKHERAPWDGVKNVKYRLESVEHNKIFTKINVDFRRFIVNSLYVVVDGQTEMNIILPQARKCKYEEFEDAYLDSTHIQILNKDQGMVDRNFVVRSNLLRQIIRSNQRRWNPAYSAEQPTLL